MTQGPDEGMKAVEEAPERWGHGLLIPWSVAQQYLHACKNMHGGL